MDDDLIRAEMHILPDNPNVLAVGTVTVANFLTVKNVRLMKGKEGNAFLSLPGEHSEKGWNSIVSVLTPELKEKIKREVMEAVKNDLGKGLGVQLEDVSIKVVPISNNGQLKGIATLDMFGFRISGIKILEQKNKNGLYVSMPQYRKNSKEWNDVVYPTSADARWKISEWVLAEYEKQIGKTIVDAELQAEYETEQVPEAESVPEQPKQTEKKALLDEISDAVIKELEYEVLASVKNNVVEPDNNPVSKVMQAESDLRELENWIEDNWPLTNKGWEEVIQKVSEYTSAAQENPTVIKQAVKMLDHYDRRAKEENKLHKLQEWIENNWPLTSAQWFNVENKVIEYTCNSKNDPDVKKEYEEMLGRFLMRKKIEKANAGYIEPHKEHAPVL